MAFLQATNAMIRLLESVAQRMEPDQICDALYLALAQPLFDKASLVDGQSRMPYLAVLGQMPEETRNPVYNALTKGVSHPL